MKKKKKKLISAFLTVMMIMSFMAVTAMAEDNVAEIVGASGYTTVQAAINNAQPGSTVRMLKDSKENITIYENDDVILDLNGHVLDGSKTATCVININQNGKLTLIDNDNDATHAGDYATLPIGGVITGGNNSSFGGGVYNCGTFIMKSGTIYGNNAQAGGGINNDGLFSMYGGCITGNTAAISGGGVATTLFADAITFGGSPVIKGNTADGKKWNLYMSDSGNSAADAYHIEIDKNNPLVDGAEIGIYYTNDNTSNISTLSSENSEDYSKYFTCDIDAYRIVLGENNRIATDFRITQQPTLENGYTVEVDMSGLDYDESELVYNWKTNETIDLTPEMLSQDSQYDKTKSGDGTYYPLDMSNGHAPAYQANIINLGFVVSGLNVVSYTFTADGEVSNYLGSDGEYYQEWNPLKANRLMIAQSPVAVSNIKFNVINEVENEHGKTLTAPVAGKLYSCEVIFKDGIRNLSDKVEGVICAETYNGVEKLNDYMDFPSAFKALKSGQKIKLLADCGEATFTVPALDADGKAMSFILDKNGKEFDGTVAVENDTDYKVKTKENKDGTVTYTVKKTASDWSTTDHDSGGKLAGIIKTIFGFKSIQMFSIGVFLSKLVELITDIFR